MVLIKDCLSSTLPFKEQSVLKSFLSDASFDGDENSVTFRVRLSMTAFNTPTESIIVEYYLKTSATQDYTQKVSFKWSFDMITKSSSLHHQDSYANDWVQDMMN